MHELSIAESLVEQAVTAARQAGGGRIVRLRVIVGELSGVDPEALAFAFPVAARGTEAEAAELDLVRSPARVECEACGAATAVEWPDLRCVQCGSDRVRIADGRQLRLELLDIEAPAATPARGANDV